MRKFSSLAVTCLLAAVTISAQLRNRPAYAQESLPAKLKDLDSHFPFQVPESLDVWNKRAEQLRLQLKVALGIHPFPQLAKVDPTIHGKLDLDGYSIEKVYFESLHGLYVTGSLYRPLTKDQTSEGKKYPVVLYAHGHWENGRFYNATSNEVSQLLSTGAERFENAATNQLQACCVQLARMGCVVFQYDMIGYADSQQISGQRAHRFGVDVPNVPSDNDGWPLFSATAEGYNQSIMGLQTINTIQSINMVQSLPDVDPDRIVITGASGGGTQSFVASAVDPRLTGSFPAVMVSTGMQGGCTCENACGLRVGTGNIEIAALTAPRPLGMTAADDWTKTMPVDGYPELQQLYALFQKKENVRLFPSLHFPHNYNHVARVALYGWVNRLFDLKQKEPVLERDFELLDTKQLTVWDDNHSMPSKGIPFEKQLTNAWATEVDQLLGKGGGDALKSEDRTKLLKEGWQTIVAPADTFAKSIRVRLEKRIDEGYSSWIAVNSDGIVVGRVECTLDDSNKPSKINKILIVDEWNTSRSASNGNVCLIGDPIQADETDDQQPLVANPRPAAAYTYGYNPPQLIRRLGVLLAIINQLPKDSKQPIEIRASGSGQFLAYAAGLKNPSIVKVIDSNEENPFTFRSVTSIRDVNFIPGSLRYQDLDGLKEVVNSLK